MRDRVALIAGAGIGGLAAGIALRQAGWRTRIFERAATPRELGFALNLAPNAMRSLKALGLAERLAAEGHVTTDVELRSPSGRVLKRLNVAVALGESPSSVAPRQALHGALLDATPREDLALGCEAVSFRAGAGRVVLTCGNGHTESGDLLVGADGLRSAVRATLHPNGPPPRRSGYYGIRGLAYDAGHHLGQLSAIAYLGHRVESTAVRASASAVYWYISLPAEDIAPGDKDTRAIVGRITARFERPLRAITEATRDEDLRIDELFDRDPIRDWGRGPVTLLGDAAHPMLPHTGQGAAQALEDAVALGIVLGRGGELEPALRLYERVRSARTGKIVRSGRQIARFSTTRSKTLDWLRARVIPFVPTRPMVAAFLFAESHDPHIELRASS
jgi:2-polyprenyl-6-methoxyphenol hydroxylase-like FAD-dependent oxidoreductase